MSYCSSCGCKIEEDDLYCPDCGAKVDQTPNQNNTLNQNTEKIGHAFEHVKSITNQINFTEIIRILKSSALNPVSGGIDFVTNAKKNSVIIITVMLALIQGILGIWRINEIVNNLQTIALDFFQNLSSLANLLGQSSSFSFNDLDSLDKAVNQIKLLIPIPYGHIFIWNCAIYLIGVFVLFIFIYLGISILAKSNCIPFSIYKTVLISSLPILSCEIISIIVSYFSIYTGVCFIVLGALISIISLAIIVKDSLQVKENLCVFIVSISSLLTLVSLSITFQNFISSEILNIVKTTMSLYGNSL
ncbi:zinc ribbon domain-containing protein [Clostridium algoriphilum]|uniref:zinc ribbon domain-containing protein n=1 Tax=Clostridium algoriphilum TaxID=198347 RepID=UPI001CF2B2D5|nr:zinc ribbon domain-containing protein [Clostridium algoriphilum]MCB2295469.1 zinc ribbon domain-containing protein [Clostridium algoriphilum]